MGHERYKKEGTVLKKKPEPTPYETAIKDLRELKAKNLWEQGMEKEYFTRLTDISANLPCSPVWHKIAMEMTSREIMDHLLFKAMSRIRRDYVRQILSVADFVKFAKAPVACRQYKQPTTMPSDLWRKPSLSLSLQQMRRRVTVRILR